MSRRKIALVLGCLLLTATVAASAQLDKILKGGGIAYVVTQFGPEINKFINKLTKTDTSSGNFDTKVVPVLSGGTGTYAGAVQVMGPRSAVAKVQAVAQIEGKFGPLGLRVRGLIPISTKSVSDIRRVPGVGISGLLDVKI
jgi:hypothetical protein